MLVARDDVIRGNPAQVRRAMAAYVVVLVGGDLAFGGSALAVHLSDFVVGVLVGVVAEQH